MVLFAIVVFDFVVFLHGGQYRFFTPPFEFSVMVSPVKLNQADRAINKNGEVKRKPFLVFAVRKSILRLIFYTVCFQKDLD